MQISIGRFAEKCNVNVETIRYYHRQGLLPLPPKRGSIRMYTDREYQVFAFIRNAKLCGLSLKDIKRLVDAEQNPSACAEIRDMFGRQIEELHRKIEGLKAAAHSLECLRSGCEECDKTQCHIVQRLSGSC